MSMRPGCADAEVALNRRSAIRPARTTQVYSSGGPAPADAGVFPEVNFGIAVDCDDAGVGMARQVRTIPTRGIDREQRVVDVNEQKVDARERAVFEELGAVAARVTAEKDAVAQRALADREVSAPGVADQLERTGDAGLDEAHAG